ncbi:MAG: energy-coupling factor transporter transmembrane component T family protein [Bryobacteraceae bacterium]
MSNQTSLIHRIDARVKLLLLVAFVVSVALFRQLSFLQLAVSFLSLICIAWAARLPVLRVLRVSLLAVPFVGVFSFLIYLSGDGQRAWAILGKSYLSAFSVLITVSTTPLPQLLSAANFFRVPALLVEVTGLIYRYLLVLSREAQQMQTAFSARSGKPGLRALQASSGMVAVLFSRSYAKAAMIHQAMCGRGFSGSLERREFRPLGLPELGIAAGGLLLTVALHFV